MGAASDHGARVHRLLRRHLLHGAVRGRLPAAVRPVDLRDSPAGLSGITGGSSLPPESDGSHQRTWNGKALYVFGNEGLAIGANGLSVAGSGSGRKESGGTFSLIPA